MHGLEKKKGNWDAVLKTDPKVLAKESERWN